MYPVRFFSLESDSLNFPRGPQSHLAKIFKPFLPCSRVRRAFFTSRSQGQAFQNLPPNFSPLGPFQRCYRSGSTCPLGLPRRQFAPCLTVNPSILQPTGSPGVAPFPTLNLPNLSLDRRAQGKCRHDYGLCIIRVKRRHGFEDEPQGTALPEPSRACPTRHRGRSRPIDLSFLSDTLTAAAHGRRVHSSIKYCIPPVGKGG